MSGHSKWSTIKHKKAVNDAKRANIFTKLAKDVTIAAHAGGDPEMNFKLRMAIDKARAFNMPKDNIERAIKCGTGELKDRALIEEFVYEAYGPGNVAMLIKVATDNKNRAFSEIRNVINKNGGKMVEGGSVSWQFEQVGSLELSSQEEKADRIDIESMEMAIIESGAKDYEKNESGFSILTDAKELKRVKDDLEKQGYLTNNPELVYVAKEKNSLNEKIQEKYFSLLEALDEHDDVVEVYDNMES